MKKDGKRIYIEKVNGIRETEKKNSCDGRQIHRRNVLQGRDRKHKYKYLKSNKSFLHE